MMRRVELVFALAVTALLAAVHVSLFVHAGPLWRDEVNSVNLVSMSFADFRENFQFDSFPVAWFGLLRAWMLTGAGASDTGLRVLGLLTGLGVLGVLWWSARRTGAQTPLFSLAFLGFNAAVVYFGDSLRAYGVGMLTGIVAFALVHQFAERPNLRRGLAAAAAALLAVQCVFYNAIVVLAACSGGAALALRRRLPATIPRLIAVGLPAALSLLMYAGTIQRQSEWNAIVRWPINLAWIWAKFRVATEMTAVIAPWTWVAFTAGSLALAIGLVAWGGAGIPDDSRDHAAFWGAALAVGVTAYLVFLLTLRYPMQPWYFLTLLALAAVCFDGILLSVPVSPRLRLVRLVAAVLLIAFAFPRVWEVTRLRRTNLDRVASTLATTATAADAIVITPWHHGLTFARYYRGAARWTTVPPMDSHQVHRWDLLMRAMEDPDAMRPALDLVAATLRQGGRVFWVGAIESAPPGQPPPALPPAPSAPWGWHDLPQYEGWGLQAGTLLRDHILRVALVPVAVEQPVSTYEDLQVTAFEGWRDVPPEPR